MPTWPALLINQRALKCSAISGAAVLERKVDLKQGERYQIDATLAFPTQAVYNWVILCWGLYVFDTPHMTELFI